MGEGAGEDVTVIGRHDLLEQGVADSLWDAALDLAFHDHRVDEASGIFDRQVTLDAHATGLGVDLDDHRVAGVGEGSGGIVDGRLVNATAPVPKASAGTAMKV